MGNYPNLAWSGADWQELSRYLRDELQEVYMRLASLQTSQEETLILRGRASFIQMMLDWPRVSAAGQPPIHGE